ITSFSAHCLVDNTLIYRREHRDSLSITHRNTAALIPFAQKDVVDSFLQGIDGRYLKIVDDALEKLSADYPSIVANHISGDAAQQKKINDKIAVETKKMAQSIRESLTSHRDRMHVAPLLEIIGILPKNELAEMAESLVNLTSLKRKMSTAMET